VTFFTKFPKCSWNQIVGVNRFPEGLVLGNSGKPVTLETSSLTKFMRYVFQGRKHAIFRDLGPEKLLGREQAIFGNLEPEQLLGREQAIFGNLEPEKLLDRERAIFGNLEPAESQSHEHAKAWNLESTKSRISEDGQFGICRRSSS
jgi:hypothetical protein